MRTPRRVFRLARRAGVGGLAALALSAWVWAAKAVPPAPRSYVHNEGVVSSAAAERLSRLLGDVERSTGHQFLAGLFQSVDGEDYAAYTNRVFKAWKIGGKKTDDGLLFALFLKERLWRVEVGYGLETTITDLEAAEIARNAGIAPFKAGDYDGGVLAVAEGLAAKLEGRPLPRPPPREPRQGAGSDESVMVFLVAGFIVLIFFIGMAGGARRTMYIGRRSGWDDWSGGGGWGGGFGGGGFSGGGDSGGGGFSGGGGSSGGGGAGGSW